MAPTRSKKRKSTESTTLADIPSSVSFPSQTLVVPAMRSPAKNSMMRSPIRKVAPASGITLGQKQALIDNLQLEITERARKLRAQYMLQAQGLRTRLEIRVNRIPMALRRAKMGELFAKHEDVPAKTLTSTPKRTAAISSSSKSTHRHHLPDMQRLARHSPSPMRPRKRLSDDISSDTVSLTDKENNNNTHVTTSSTSSSYAITIDDLSNPKKRIRANNPPAAPVPQPPRVTTSSRAPLQPSQYLSPKSSNSRIIPGAAAAAVSSSNSNSNSNNSNNNNININSSSNTIIRSQTTASSPHKSLLARPVSPTKPAGAGVTRANSNSSKTAAGAAAAAAAVGAAARQRRTQAQAQAAQTLAKPGVGNVGGSGGVTRRISAGSESSDASSGTTVVVVAGPARARAGATAATKRGAAAAAAAAPAAAPAAAAPTKKKKGGVGAGVMGAVRGIGGGRGGEAAKNSKRKTAAAGTGTGAGTSAVVTTTAAAAAATTSAASTTTAAVAKKKTKVTEVPVPTRRVLRSRD